MTEEIKQQMYTWPNLTTQNSIPAQASQFSSTQITIADLYYRICTIESSIRDLANVLANLNENR